jgi:NAD(P)-dependent dehydrogenase (short-subunit alcohol dehydrogenase family)
MTKNNNKDSGIALVTGAGSRIGREIALGLSRVGWSVAIHYSQSHKNAQVTANDIRELGGAAEIFCADLRDEKEVKSLIPNICDKLGNVTCLINNASVFEQDNIETASLDSWLSHMQVNLQAPFFLSQAMVVQGKLAERKNIINIIDQRVLNLTPFFSSYTISKSALWTLTQTLAISLAPEIRVNAVSPGPTLPSSRQDPEQFKQQYLATPLKKSVAPSEIVDAVLFILATPSMTGQMITIDSGQHLGWSIPETNEKSEE